MDKILNILKEEVENFIKEEEYFTAKLPDDVKKHSKKYVGRGVTWYGDPEQMIVVHKDNVHGMWGNIYNPEKLQYVQELIRNSPENVEFECSYAMGNVVDIQDIAEHQNAVIDDRFYTDFDGHDEPYTTGDETLDKYVGTDEIDDLEFVSDYISNPDIIKFFENHKMDLAYNKYTKDQLLDEFRKLNPDESELQAFEEFAEIEENLGTAIANNYGDLNEFKVQLRDAHHRVMGAIEAGEEYVCVNLEKDDLRRFGNYVNKV